MSSPELMLGIDVGTTAVKVAAFTVDGTEVASHRVDYAIARPRPGWAEQNPLDWWNGVVEGIYRVTSAIPNGYVRSVGIVSQVNTHVFTDEQLQPLAPAIIWQDQRCAAAARELDALFTAVDKSRIFGAAITLDASYLPARALWMSRETPSVWSRTRWVLSPKDFIAAKLTGQLATDRLSAVRLTSESRYIPEALALVDGLAQAVPEIMNYDSRLGRSLDPLPSGVPVAVGTMDAFGAIFGTGTATPGRGMISSGTSLVVSAASRQSYPEAGVVTFPALDGVHVHAGPTQAAGDAVRWWSHASGLGIEEVFATAEHGERGVIFTPYLQGERAPLWDPDPRAAFLGLSASTTQAAMSRAVLTGVAMSGRHVLEAVERAGGQSLPTLRLCGGGARSDLWAQIHADVLNRPIERLRVHDAAALGAASLGAVAAGTYADIDSAADATVGVERVFAPSPEAENLEPLYQAYRTAHTALHDIHKRLDNWRDSTADSTDRATDNW